MTIMEAGGYKIHIASDEAALCDALALRLVELAQQFIESDGIFTLLLSGGSTPRGLYSALARMPKGVVPWDKIYLFLGDERCVSHSDAESNYRMVSDSLLSHISIPSTNVFPTINQDVDPADSAKRYEQAIRRFFNNRSSDPGGASVPEFSCALMGLGPDGHTASLFPDTEAIGELSKLCVANYVPKFESYRITLTRPVFTHCQKVIFLVAGDGKKDILKEVLLHPEKGYPSQVVAGECSEGVVEFYIDEAASKNIK